jgi:phosphoribosylanthranilate isomerase
MSPVRVKICGVTNEADAHLVVASGADMLGLIVDVPVETPRKISLAKAAAISKAVGEAIPVVTVLAPSSAKDVARVVQRVQPFAVQLHGFEPPALLKAVRTALPEVKMIKTVHVDEGGTIHGELPDTELVDFILLDTFSAQLGGTGAKHNWSTSKAIVDQSPVPVILSGGLNHVNVADAIRTVKPYGVDVASGVESVPGRKSVEKVVQFVRNARCT